MAERVTLTSEQAEALQALRVKHRNENLWKEETDVRPVDEETRPHKMLILPGITERT